MASGTTSWPTPSPAITAMENSVIDVSIMEARTPVLASIQTLYGIENAEALLTPALAIYPEIVDRNIDCTLRLLDGDANRWRPHVKTSKLGFVMRQLVEHGIA